MKSISFLRKVKFYKKCFSKKNYKNYYHSERKSIKWYYRPKEYNMNDGDIYKNFLIKKKNENLELLPLSKIDSTNNSDETKTLFNSEYTNYESCLIWLYDGDNPEYFIEHLLEFNNFPPKKFKIVLHRAPFNPITFDTILLQRSWFNIFDLPDASGYRSSINKKEIEKMAKNHIHREIQDQYNLIGDYKKIFIGGFSQSACMALYSTLTYSKANIGGCIAFSGFNFDFTPLDPEKKEIPILCINGDKDEVVITRHAKNSYDSLIKLGFNINYIQEPGLAHFFTKSGLIKANNLLTRIKAKENKISKAKGN